MEEAKDWAETAAAKEKGRSAVARLALVGRAEASAEAGSEAWKAVGARVMVGVAVVLTGEARAMDSQAVRWVVAARLAALQGTVPAAAPAVAARVP